MILRRLAHRIRHQDWMAIGIELLIVILGVFIAFQVTDWGDERANRSAEKRHLEEIREDLREDVRALEMVHKAALMRISSIDYILGEVPGVTRPSRLSMPTGETFEIPAGTPVTAADRNLLLSRANLVRITMGNRTGFEALIGAGGMRTIRDRQITRQLQVYYAQFDDMMGTQTMLRQIRTEGVALGYPLGLSAFGEMDADKLIGVVRASATYSAYLRTTREWSAIHLATADQQKERALKLLADIDAYLGHGQRSGKEAVRQ
ncbi:MAG: hypothetical protein OEW50_13285 [Gammaproteobacteria bacterium]|nr:hypothetical protein [Gammaproteobacteria bacterium]MDH5177634.1 hypothetical protein [Gammaproteobacteria bacterium]MDH5228370.1 hypothetical protein [Gammaproteobacteria bacterium]